MLSGGIQFHGIRSTAVSNCVNFSLCRQHEREARVSSHESDNYKFLKTHEDDDDDNIHEIYNSGCLEKALKAL